MTGCSAARECHFEDSARAGTDHVRPVGVVALPTIEGHCPHVQMESGAGSLPLIGSWGPVRNSFTDPTRTRSDRLPGGFRSPEIVEGTILRRLRASLLHRIYTTGTRRGSTVGR